MPPLIATNRFRETNRFKQIVSLESIQAPRTLGTPRLLTVRDVAERLQVCKATEAGHA